MKRLSTILFLTILLTSAQWSFGQTATPTPTDTATATATPTATETRAPVYKVGAIQANNPAGLPILGSDGSTLELIGPSGLILDASQVTAGTFGDGSYVFQDNLTFSGTDPVLNFPNSDYIKYTNSSAQITFNDGTTDRITLDLDDGIHAIGAAPNAGYKLYVLNSGSSGPDYGGYFSNTSTEGSSEYGIAAYTTGSHTGNSFGVRASSANGSGNNYGGYLDSIGSTGVGYGIYTANTNTSTSNQYGASINVTGSQASSTHYGAAVTASGGGTNYGLYPAASGGTTNWAIYTAGGDTRIGGTLQLTDTGQQITVNTTDDRFLFGNGTDASQVMLDTTYGDVLLKGRLNLDAGSALTISSNAVTVIRTRHSLTASGASDTLNTINGGVSGDILYLTGTAGKTITVADGAGNIECNTNRTLDGTNDWMTLMYDGSKWQMLSIALDN